MSTVLKHGSHDQSSHGRKGGSGSVDVPGLAEGVRIQKYSRAAEAELRADTDNPYLSNLYDDYQRYETVISMRDSNGKVVGLMSLQEERGSKLVMITGLHAHPDRNGEGIGTTLMQSAAKYTRSLPRGDQYEMSVYGSLESARSFYERFSSEGRTSYTPDDVARMAGVVEKHGSHNQKDHAGKRGGASDLPEGWSKSDPDKVREGLILEYMGHGNGRSTAESIANNRVDNYDYFDGPNGSRVLIEKPTALRPDRKQFTPDEVRPVLEEVSRLQGIAPVGGMKVTIGESEFTNHGPQVAGFAAFAYRGKGEIFMRPRAVTPGLEPDVLMPAAATNRTRYGVAHEWGHTVDRRTSTQAAIDHDRVLGMSGMSTYGRSDKYESYAEAFAEWSLTGGRSESPAVSYFSETYNWGSEGMAKAVAETVEICGDTFTAEGAGTIVMERPDPAAEIRKAVIVAFAPGLRPVLKHGSHNQKDHGRRGGGATLKPDVASSILERVKANGGLSVNMLDGSEPTKGFMVAKGGDIGDIVPADKFFDPVEGPKALSSFMKANRDTLTKGSYLGLWHNTADGNVYLDVSDNILDRATATRAGRDRNQISIWDVANFREIDTGGTGELAKTSSGHSDAGHLEDDRRRDRRIRKERVGEVHGAGVVIRFAPGLRPVLKHGTHNQQSHAGNRGASAADQLRSVPGQYTPPGGGNMRTRSQAENPKSRPPARPDAFEEYESRQDAIARALMRGDFDGLDIGPSRLNQAIGGAIGNTERKVIKFAERFGVKLSRNKRHSYSAEQATALRESYYERYGRPTWMQKAVSWLKGLFDE